MNECKLYENVCINVRFQNSSFSYFTCICILWTPVGYVQGSTVRFSLLKLENGSMATLYGDHNQKV